METQNETNTTTTSSGSTDQSAAGATEAAKTGFGQGSGQATSGASGAAATGAGNATGVSTTAGKATTEQQAPYTPNFKFKVKDKELEFDDFVKPIVKDKTLEQKFRDMYEKAHGIEEVKSSRDTFKAQAEEWKGKFSQVETGLKSLGDVVKKKDYDTFFDTFKISEEDIINWSIQKLKYRELPPEQRAAIDAQRQQQTEFEQAQHLNLTLQQQLQQVYQAQATMELNQELAKPDVVTAAASYDARTGVPGSYRQEIIRRGQYYEAVHKISPPASQLVQELNALIGASVSSQQAQGTTSQGQSGQTPTVPAQQTPVIPAFQSGGGAKSPVRKTISSIDDIRKLRQQTTT